MKKYICLIILLLISVNAFAENVIVWYRPDGGISVTRPNYDSTDIDRLNKTIAKKITQDYYKDCEYEIRDVLTIPDSRKYDVKYWKGVKGGAITVDDNKIKEDELAILLNERAKEIAQKQAEKELKEEGLIE